MSANKTAFFTFGQAHVHRVNGKTFDCDCVVKITSPDPRQTMFENFGAKWSMEYKEMTPKTLKFFKRGIINL